MLRIMITEAYIIVSLLITCSGLIFYCAYKDSVIKDKDEEIDRLNDLNSRMRRAIKSRRWTPIFVILLMLASCATPEVAFRKEVKPHAKKEIYVKNAFWY